MAARHAYKMDPKMEVQINKAIEVLKSGGVILYPTDTIWGVGCDATNPEAVKKVFAIKKREESKSLVTLVSDLDMLARYVKDIPANPDVKLLLDPEEIVCHVTHVKEEPVAAPAEGEAAAADAEKK